MQRGEWSGAQGEGQSLKGVVYPAGHPFERGVHTAVVEKRMTAKPSALGVGGGVSPTPPANYLAGSFNLKNQFPPWQVRYAYFILR